MRMNKYKFRKLLLSALCIVFLVCAFLGYALFGNKTADALPQVPSSTTVAKELYDFENYCYNQDALDELASQILQSQTSSYGSNPTFSNLISYAQGTAGRTGRSLVNKSINVKYGRYRFTEVSTSYNNLVWMPVYISTAANGDAILTLYLAATETIKGTSQQEQGYFSTQGFYSTDYDIGGPSNSYGTSQMRSISLGAMQPYATYPGGVYRLKEDPEIKESNCNKFSDFINGKDFKGILYDDIVSPSEISWQAHESFAAYASDFLTSGFSTTYANYCWPNESYDTPSTGTYYLPGYFDYAIKNRTQYNDWKNDKVWLPSLTEVGDGDLDPNGANTTNGIWGLTASQRSNKQVSWLRTAKTDAPRITNNGYSYSTYTMFCLDTDGSITSADLNAQCAIRPAIHLNLSKISGKTTPSVKLPDVITTSYTGEVQTIADVSDDQKTWYVAEHMTIVFYTDEACTRPFAPIDAGTYYMLVRLDSSSGLQFFGEEENTTYKSTKFVVEKLKLDITWTYNEDGTPNKVEFADLSQFFDRDQDLIPALSFYYKSITDAGDKYYDYPDVMGHYRAYAYILDEQMFKYNYELSSNISSNQFYVSERILAVPEFCYGEADDISADHRTLTIPYKGKNFVQIKNISPSMIVTVTASPEEALNSLVDLGLNDAGIKTYRVTDVARYEFTVTLSEKEMANAKWSTSTDITKDISPKKLVLAIEQAEITVTFEGLLSSWDTLTSTTFSLGIVGVQAGDPVEMRVYYQPSRGGNQIDLKADDSGRYTIPKGLTVGEYTLAATIAGTGQQTGPYKMASATTQKFTITQATSSFGKDLVVWQYSVDGRTQSLNELGSGNTSSTAVELDYTGGYYQFTITMEESRLQAYYYVRANYSGDIYVKDAGTYSVTVTILAYDKNVSFETQNYTIYFKINKTSFDMSNVTWDYPGTYRQVSGKTYSVLLDNVPDGLTVSYTDNKASSAGDYTAKAVFSVSDDYAANYEVPESMTLQWSISADSGIVLEKVDYDTSSLVLRYTHGGSVKDLTWNTEQKKWFDSNGNEFVLSFTYDGIPHTLELFGNIPDLTIGTASNNSYTNAGSYLANFNLTEETSGVYNTPTFGVISWKVEKAEISFDNVKWGYIDEDGNEYEVDFDNNPFVFTRNENGTVKFHVGLINLPEGFSLNYSTVCLTKTNSIASAINYASEVGDYQTSFTRAITFNDPNYETITSIPSFIPSFQYWKIQEREFTPISYDGSWKEFDGRTHDLLDLCGMPKDELDYFRVEIAFLDGGNNLENYYEGYGGVPYAAYHAGTYIVRFYELRGDAATEYFWDSVEIVVGKESLEVTWDSKGSIPVARVTGLYITEMIGTKYTTESGVEVRTEYIKATDGVTFYAEPYLMKEYENDLIIVMANGQPEQFEFTYWYYKSTDKSYAIDKSEIRFRYDSIEYTGSPITFEILYGGAEDSRYLYYEGDSLTQTKVGTYAIEINFIKYDANTGAGDAYWKGTDDDRSSLKLTFEITSPTKVALEYPKLNSYSEVYTGNPITFTITNWGVLQEYLKYEVTYDGTPVYGDKLKFTAAGNYTITFSFLPDSIGYWNADPENPKKSYTLTFRIIDPENTTSLTNPQLATSFMTATGGELTFEIANWASYYNAYCDITDGSLTQTAPGTYHVTLTIKDEFSDLLFANGSRSYTLTFVIGEGDEPDGPKTLPLPIVSSEPKEFTGDDILFVENWDQISQYVEVVDERGSIISASIYQKEVGEYTVYLHIKDEYRGTITWADGSETDKMLTFSIIPATVDVDKITVESDGKVTAPNGTGDKVDFDDFFEYKYYDKDGFEVSADELVDGEEYTVTVTFKPEMQEKFEESFVNSEEIKQALTNKSFTFTYDSGTKDNKLLIIITIAEVVVLVFLIIATVIVLLIQHKLYDTDEDDYDDYDDYEEDDE